MATAIQLVDVPAPSLHLQATAIEAGLSIEALTDFVASSGLPWKDVYDIVIPARTLKHRRARHEVLSRDESDKLARLIRVYGQALNVFTDHGKTLRFLGTAKPRFEARTPLQMLQTEVGGREVEAMLWQIADGVFI